MKIFSRVALLAVAGSLVSTQARAQTATDVLARASTRYATIRTLQADFRQTIVNPMLGGPEVATGVLFLEPPDRFAMRFTDPAGDRIVADGTWLWLFNPSTVSDQVIKTPIPEAGPATPNLFAQFVDDPLSRYEVEYMGPDNIDGIAVERVHLIPLSDEIPFREATIYVDVSGGMLRALQVIEESGQSRHMVFENFRRNQPIAAHELQFTPPSGVRVITPGR